MPLVRTSFACAALASLALAVTGAPAFAAPPAPTANAVIVDTHDLDLAQPSDARLALVRIEAAARQACIAPGFAIRMSVRGCTRVVVADAVRALKAPSLTAAWKAGPRRGSQLAAR